MIFTPDFYTKFKCIADKCQDSCCVGWEIDVDAETLEKFKCLGDEILPLVELDAAPPYIRLDGEGRCPFLDDSGLCKIISKRGEDFIPEICKRHPRYFNDILGFTECSVGLSCPTAAEIILSVCEKPSIVKLSIFSTNEIKLEEKEDEIPTNEENTIKNLLEIRDKLFEFVFDTERGIAECVAGIIEYQGEVSDYLFGGDLPREIRGGDTSSIYGAIDMITEASRRIELLSDEHRVRMARFTREEIVDLLLANDAYSRALLYYFLHRYMLSGAGAFDLDDRLVLCILLLFLCLAFTDGQVTAASVALFSKNVEYSTENIDVLLEIIAERY